MKIKTSELVGAALNWAVAQCENRNVTLMRNSDGSLFPQPVWANGIEQLNYSTFWAQGGPIIEREGIGFFCNRTSAIGARFRPDAGADWRAFALNKHGTHYYGSAALIAAMRCYVASKLGEEVDVPEELINDLNRSKEN